MAGGIVSGGCQGTDPTLSIDSSYCSRDTITNARATTRIVHSDDNLQVQEWKGAR